MGNIEQRMAKTQSLDELSQTLKNLQQTRSDSQIQITDKLTYLLSDLNIKRISQHKEVSAKNLDWSNYVFVCVQGFPALKQQFSMLELPGETIYFGSRNFEKQAQNLSHQQRMKIVYESTFKHQANRLNKILLSIDNRKKLIFVYHSAGNFILSMYFYYYGYGICERVKGMIDIAGAPLRYYFSAQMLVPLIMATDFRQIADNADKTHKLFLKMMSKTGFDLGFKTKFETLSFLHYVKSPNYGEIFEATWNHPNVLKLFIHGRNDTLFDSKLLNEKAIYYAYRKELQKSYVDRIKGRYKKLYNPKQLPENVQERFILAIPRGQHSIHNNERNHEIIRAAVHQYLTVIYE